MWIYLLAWFPMLLLAIGNRVLREAVLKKWMDEKFAQQFSTVTLLLFLSIYISLILWRYPATSFLQALFIGVLWMLLTIAFEFGFGRWRGLSWQTLLADYNLLAGRLWALVPVWILLAPCLFFLFVAGI